MVCYAISLKSRGYSTRKHHLPSVGALQDQAISRRFVEFHIMYPVLALDSLHHMFQPEFGFSSQQIHRLMRNAGISSARRRPRHNELNSRSRTFAKLAKTTICCRRTEHGSGRRQPLYSNRRGLALCCHRQGSLYKKVVGYAFSNRIDTILTVAGPEMAVRYECPQRDFIFHSDRASGTPCRVTGMR